MKNWIQRLAIFAVVGAVLSSSILVGCGGNSDSGDATPTKVPADSGE